MAKVVLVHGIAQEQVGADTLETIWLPALAGSIRKAGFSAIADRIWRDRTGPEGIDVRMAHYGDLFLEKNRQGAGPSVATDEALAESIGLEWLKRAATRSADPRTRATAGPELAYVQHRFGTEQSGLRSATRSAINSLGKLSWFAPYGMAVAQRFANQSLAQVTLYLSDERIRQEALRSVQELLTPDTAVVIGHSLGSVVAYEAVSTMSRPLPLLVTLGSPLGLQTIVFSKVRPQPPVFPPRLGWWVNVADRNDLVAAEPDLTSMFSSGLPGQSRFEGGFTVDNGSDAHNAAFYLGKIETGRPVGEVLSAV